MAASNSLDEDSHENAESRDDARSVPLGVGGVSAQTGDHIAHFYRGQAERFSVLGPYIHEGLRQGDRCVFISSPDIARELCDWLEEHHEDPQPAIDSGQLLLDPGRATKEEMLRLATRVERSTSAGEATLIRWAGDGSWNLTSDMSVAEMLHWEALYDKHSSGWEMLALCQFDRSQFSGDVLMGALRSHPYCIMGNVVVPNPDYTDPQSLLDDLSE